MGLFSDVGGALFGGDRKMPNAPAFGKDPYYGNPDVQRRIREMDDLYGARVTENLARSPGYSDEYLRMMRIEPQERIRERGAAAERRLTRSDVSRGSYRGGSHEKRRGDIAAEEMALSASAERQALRDAAEAEIRDRYQQLMAAGAYMDPRLAGQLGYTGMQNNYNLGVYGQQSANVNAANQGDLARSMLGVRAIASIPFGGGWF